MTSYAGVAVLFIVAALVLGARWSVESRAAAAILALVVVAAQAALLLMVR